MSKDKLGVITLTRTPRLFGQLADLLVDELPEGTLPIVVDNAVDAEVGRIAVANRWACVEPGRNLSFAEGNNVAAEVARTQGCTHLLLINDDVLPDEDFVRKLWACRGYAKDGAMGAVLVQDDGNVNHAGSIVQKDGGTDHMGRGQPVSAWQADKVVPVPAVTFAVALIPTDLWVRLQGLDVRYLWGWEDTDFCLRVLEAGGSNYVCRSAVAVHNECGTRPRGSRTDELNRELFIATWRGRLAPALKAYHARKPEAEGVYV